MGIVIGKDKEKSHYWHVSNGFSSFLQSYTRAMNKMYNRTGAIFETPFKRIEVKEDSYFSTLISYIHKNPEKHGLVDDFRDYPYSSYHAHLLDHTTKLSRSEVLEWFGGKEAYQNFHIETDNKLLDKNLLLESSGNEQ